MWIAEKGQEPDTAALIDPAHTALLVIDIQNDFCHPRGAFGTAGYDTGPMQDMADRAGAVIQAARQAGMLIVFVRAVYDEAVTSRVLAANRHRRGLKFSLCLEGTWGAEWFAPVRPDPESPREVVITKHRFDAFHGTPLDLYLRSNDIRTVVAVGTATSGCVESTVRDAFFHDYACVVAPDCVADTNAEGHRNSLTILQRSFARFLTSETLAELWRGRNRPPAGVPGEMRTREALVLVDAASAPAAVTLLGAARASGVMILHVRTRASVAARSVGGRAADAVVPAGEFEVVKFRASAFADTRLGQLLRTNMVGRVVLAGAAADLDVSARDGMDRDFTVELARDAVDFAPEEAGDAGAWQRLLAARGVGFADVPDIAARWATRRITGG